MIQLTIINKNLSEENKECVDPDRIFQIEDGQIILNSGYTLFVKESEEEIVKKILQYKKALEEEDWEKLYELAGLNT